MHLAAGKSSWLASFTPYIGSHVKCFNSSSSSSILLALGPANAKDNQTRFCWYNFQVLSVKVFPLACQNQTLLPFNIYPG